MSKSNLFAPLDQQDNVVPDAVTSIHIMGICGTGMAALAGMLQQKGYIVEGSDANVYPPMSTLLKQLNITVFEGYSSGNICSSPDLIIIGNVIRRDNPTIKAVAERKLPYISFPQALRHFFIEDKQSLVVAGTHGKTTTCSLLASVLHHARKNPSFMIGGIVREFDSNFKLGTGDQFISEGDEYDTAFFDKESKFLHYNPHTAILTSIEFDHADIFTDLDDIKRSFVKFVTLLPEDGLLIANLEDKNVREIITHAKCTVVGYGLNSNNRWRLENFSADNGMTRFSVYRNNEFYNAFSLQLPGLHNALNALAVIAAGDSVGLSANDMIPGLKDFGGVKRRQEVRGIKNGITVIDDFAHHPTAVRKTLEALKPAYSGKRLICVFEPRTNSSRRAIFQQQYVSCFGEADMVIVRDPVPLENVAEEYMFSSYQLAADLKKRKIDAHRLSNADEIIAFLQPIARAGDVIAVFSNGGFENIHERLLEIL